MEHIREDGTFRSDKYPDLPPDRVVLSLHKEADRKALYIFCQNTDDANLAHDLLYRMERILRKEGENGIV